MGRARVVRITEVSPCEMHRGHSKAAGGRLGVRSTQLEPEVLKNELTGHQNLVHSANGAQKSTFPPLLLSRVHLAPTPPSTEFLSTRHLPCELRGPQLHSSPLCSAGCQGGRGSTDIQASCLPWRVCPWEALERN